MSEETFLSHRNMRWFWVSGALVLLFVLWYIVDHPIGGRNGGTVFGYTAGTVSALIMIFLMWYAKRKRAYLSTLGTLKGWLAAHVWFGMALLFLVPLHAGFSFGLNLHTALFAFMMLTIVTGIWGAILFVQNPPRMQARRAGFSFSGALKEVRGLESDLASIGDGHSDGFHRLINLLDVSFKPSIWSILFLGRKVNDVTDEPQVSTLIAALSEKEQQEALRVVGLAHKRIRMCNTLVEEVRLQSLLKVWLYFHVPLATGAIVLLVIHIFAVFYRW